MRKTALFHAVAAIAAASCIAVLAGPAAAQGGLSAVWANDGGDKVLAEERRASGGLSIVPAHGIENTVWNGKAVSLFGARNESVGFNLILESINGAKEVGIKFDRLEGPDGALIGTREARGDGVFDYRGRNIEMFLLGYLPIKGVSKLSYDLYDERWVPSKLRRPYNLVRYGNTWRTESVRGKDGFKDRPAAGKSFPEIAVPLEARPPFEVPANRSQSVWVDIHIPEAAKPGVYRGTITVTEAGAGARAIPVSLTVRSFMLPHTSAATAIAALGHYDISERFFGEKARFADRGSGDYKRVRPILDRYMQMMRRHRVLTMFDEGAGVAPPPPEVVDRLQGKLYSAARGYDGPGKDTGDNVFFIAPYGSWKWKAGDQRVFNAQSDAWMNWFAANAPKVRKYLYLVDEPNLNDVVATREINGWLDKLAANPGVGKGLPTFITVPATLGRQYVPRASALASWYAVANTAPWDAAVEGHLKASAVNEIWQYNGKRPASGSFAIEDDGVALRVVQWAAAKKGIAGWFYWNVSYYNDYQNGAGRTDVWRQAKTFGLPPRIDPANGETGSTNSNGDGVLAYPGVDVLFPDAPSPGLMGPVASLRLKLWRRGIQDADYIALAMAKNPAATRQIVDRMVRKVLWEVGVYSQQDPSYQYGGEGDGIGWSTNPDDWEKARAALADIIEGK